YYAFVITRKIDTYDKSTICRAPLPVQSLRFSLEMNAAISKPVSIFTKKGWRRKYPRTTIIIIPVRKIFLMLVPMKNIINMGLNHSLYKIPPFLLDPRNGMVHHQAYCFA